MIRGYLAQYFYSMYGRIQWFAKFGMCIVYCETVLISILMDSLCYQDTLTWNLWRLSVCMRRHCWHHMEFLTSDYVMFLITLARIIRNMRSDHCFHKGFKFRCAYWVEQPSNNMLAIWNILMLNQYQQVEMAISQCMMLYSTCLDALLILENFGKSWVIMSCGRYIAVVDLVSEPLEHRLPPPLYKKCNKRKKIKTH